MALLRMVALAAGFRGVTFFGREIGEDQKKQGLHHKPVELWFRIIIWCQPKMVSPGASRPRSPSYATALIDEIKVLILTVSTFILAIFHSRFMALFHCHDA